MSKQNTPIPQLLQTLQADVLTFLRQAGVPLVQKLCNEATFQLYLSQNLLQTKHYDDVQVEYLVKKGSLGLDPTSVDNALLSDNNLFIDIVVEKKGEYALLELKFPLHIYSSFHPKRFDEVEIKGKKDSTATNNTCHDYWVDVRRIELIKKRYQHVVGGIALLLTNVSIYWTGPRDNARYRGMAIHEGSDLSELRAWLDDAGNKIERMTKAGKIIYPNFELDHGYQPAWIDVCETEKVKFRACTVVVY